MFVPPCGVGMGWCRGVGERFEDCDIGLSGLVSVALATILECVEISEVKRSEVC